MGGLRVVIVDDVESIRHVVGLLIAGGGHEVIGEARDGAEGVELILELMPDVVIMDWSMPKLDGVEATRKVLQKAPHLAVIAFSSADNAEVRTAFLDAGAVAYHQKSDIDGLRASLSRLADPAGS